jgi:dihydrofolate synthase/folylpolyglutamate synthase
VHLVVGMLRTKDASGFLRPLASVAQGVSGVGIPGEGATLTAEETVAAARAAGLAAGPAASPIEAVRSIVARAPSARILICGSLYLAGQILRENG